MRIRFFWMDGSTEVVESNNLKRAVLEASAGGIGFFELDFYITDKDGRDIENHGYVFCGPDGWRMDLATLPV